MQEYLQEAFAPGGHLSQHLEGYAPRQGQIDYAQAVDQAIRDGRHLLVEGPPGTGKSLGYGVPAAYHAAKHGKRVLVVTSNIALQEQLITKDLPLIADAVPWPFRYRMLKGKANYLCLWRSGEYQQTTRQLFPDSDDTEMAQAIITWGAMTVDGDKSELPFDPPPRVWRQFSVSSDECLGSKCGHAQQCFPLRARGMLEDAQVIVTNYHLLFSHLVVMEAVGRPIVLPEFDVLVMDEAHHAADIAREFLGFRVTHRAIERIANMVGGGDQADLTHASETFFSVLRSHYSRSYKTRLKKLFGKHTYGEVCGKLCNAAEQLAAMAPGATDPMERAKLRKGANRAAEIAAQIDRAMTDREGDTAYSLEKSKGGHLTIVSKQVDVSGWLRESLFDAVSTVVATSATLATGTSFDFLAGELGADHYEELIVSSPFDWSKQAILVMPPMPDPRSEGFRDKVAEAVAAAVKGARGRTLALFTSYRNLNHVYDALRAKRLPYSLLRQGDLPRTQLVEAFKEETSSVLLATASMWQGVDVPGEALSCLVIDKLPFPSPDDPVLDLIQERDSKAFFNHSVPRAVIALKQGVGRLIRTVDDVGVVVLLDCRLTTKGYGRQFLKSLPRTVKSRDLGVVRQFLDDMAAGRATA